MPLLLCPNCNASMQAVNRAGVEIDMCPQCRGVWMDRGELEKVLAEAKQGEVEQRRARETFEREVSDFHRDPEDWRRRHPYDAERKRYRYEDDHYRHKRKKKFDLFDIFD